MHTNYKYPVIYRGEPIGYASDRKGAVDVFFDKLDSLHGSKFRDGRNLSAIRIAYLDAENATRTAEGLEAIDGDARLAGGGNPHDTGWIIDD